MGKVTLIDVNVKVCKESHEVFVAAEKIIADIRAKKDLTEIALGSLSQLKDAVEGIDQLDDEVKDVHFYETAGLGGARLTRAIIGQKDSPEEVAE